MLLSKSFGRYAALSRGLRKFLRPGLGLWLAAAALSDARADSYTTVGPLNTARRYHTATLLQDGTIFVAGGSNGSVDLNTAEIYNPATRSWSYAAPMTYARRSHTATLLQNGRVLVAGGVTGTTNMVFVAELYDPVLHTWSTVGALFYGRANHTATLLTSGKVLVAGGSPWQLNAQPPPPPGLPGGPQRPQPPPPPTCTAETWDPVTWQWSSGGSLHTCRYLHAAAPLPSGQVLIVGGSDGTSALASEEFYDPVLNTWATGPNSMSFGRISPAITLLPNGAILLAGGKGTAPLNSAEYYIPSNPGWQSTFGLVSARNLAAMVTLPGGLALLTGGFDGVNYLATSELYNPGAGTWSLTGVSMGHARQDHTATALADGTVVVTGGYNPTEGVLAATEVYQSGWGGMTYAGDGVVPPDPGGAAGPNGILQTVNTRLAYFNKDGSRRNAAWISDVQLSSFFPGVQALIEDPKVIFDVAAGTSGRFYVVMEENYDPCYYPLGPASYLHLAVSKDNDPSDATGNSWYFYTITMMETVGTAKYGVDYPGIGIDAQALYVTYNMFRFKDASFPYCWGPQPCSGNTAYNCQILVINKSDIVTGQNPPHGRRAFTQANTPGKNDRAFSLQPVTPVDGGVGHDWVFFVESSNSDWDPSGTHVRLWYIEHPLAIPQPYQVNEAARPSFVNSTGGGQACGTGAPQPTPDPLNPPAQLSTVEGNRTLGNAVSIGNDIWFCSTEGGPSRALATWYHLGVSGFPASVLASSGQIDPGNGVWTFYPTLTANANGDVCMVFSESSSALDPSIGYVWRLASDPVSPPSAVFRPPQTLLVSPYLSYAVLGDTVERWGDFGSVSVDPQDGTFWLSHEMVPLSNLIPPGQTYNGGGEFDLTLQSNQGYTILWGANDASVTLCGTQHNSTGAGTVTKVTTVNCGSPILQCFGGAGSPVTLRVTQAHDYGTWWNQVYIP